MYTMSGGLYSSLYEHIELQTLYHDISQYPVVRSVRSNVLH